MKDPTPSDEKTGFLRLSEAFKRFDEALWRGEPKLPTVPGLKPEPPRSLTEDDHIEAVRAAHEFRDEQARNEFLKMLARGKTTAFVEKKTLERVPRAYWRGIPKGPAKEGLDIFDRCDEGPLFLSAAEADRTCEEVRVSKLKILRESHWSLNRVQVWRSFRSLEAIRYYRREPSQIGVHDPFLTQLREETELEIEEAGRRGELPASGRNNSGARGKRIPLTPDYWIDHACQNKIVEEEEENTLGVNPVWDLVFSTEDVLRVWQPTNSELAEFLPASSEGVAVRRPAPREHAATVALKSAWGGSLPPHLPKEAFEKVEAWLGSPANTTGCSNISRGTIRKAFRKIKPSGQRRSVGDTVLVGCTG